MTTAVAASINPAKAAIRAPAYELLFRLGGLGLLLSAASGFLGGIWDIQWHEDVGPDTFFTAPHLLLYLGAAGAGLTSLAVTLLGTWWVRRGTPPDPALVPLLGRTFWAPLGFVIAGIGSLVFLGFGLFDLWWHTIYGFDAVLHSPPHTGLGLGDLITLSGGIVVFAMLAMRDGRRESEGGRLAWPVVGLATATAIFLINSAAWQVEYREPFFGLIDGQLLFVAGLYPLALLMVASVTRRAGVVALTGAMFTLLAAGSWLFSALATPRYAEAVGLFVRDDAFGYPRIVAVLPLLLFPAAVVIDLVLSAARRRDVPVRRGVMLAAAVGMLLLVGLESFAARGVFVLPDAAAMIATALAAALLGALTGWLGWKLGVVLRHLAGSAGKSVGVVGRPVAAVVAMLILTVWLSLPLGTLAHGGGPLVEVHRETVVAGPYRIEVGFTEWPLRAERSLDIIIHADEGITGKQGTISLTAPSGWRDEGALVRHPRQREDWGLDVIALPEAGTWTVGLTIDGPFGPGTGSLPVTVGPRPGPPEWVGWLPPLAVVLGMAAAVVAGWRRVRPSRQPETWAWATG